MQKKYAIKTILIPAAEVFAKLIAFVNILLMIRVLSIDDYADYSYIVSIVLWASVVMDGGFSNLIFNESLRNQLQKINLYFSARFFLSIIVIIFIAVFFIGVKPLLTAPGILFSIVILVTSSSSIIKMIARGLEIKKVDATVILTEPLLRFIMVASLYFGYAAFEWTLWKILLIYLIASIITIIISYNYLKQYFKLEVHFEKLRVIGKNLVLAFKASKYYLLYYFIFVGLSRMDILVIEANLPKHELAFFSSSYTIFTVVLLFFMSFNTSHFKKIIKQESVYIKYMFLVLIGVVIFFYFSSDFIFELLFPESYYSGAIVLKRIMFAIIPSALSGFFIVKNNYFHRSKINFIILLIPFFIKLILYLLLQPKALEQYTNIFVFCELILFLSFVFYEWFIKKSITSKV